MSEPKEPKRERVGSVRLCLELVESRTGRDTVWGIVGSIPGRESVVTYQWKAHYGVLTESQFRDIGGRVTALLTQAIVMLEGVQGELRLVK